MCAIMQKLRVNLIAMEAHYASRAEVAQASRFCSIPFGGAHATRVHYSATPPNRSRMLISRMRGMRKPKHTSDAARLFAHGCSLKGQKGSALTIDSPGWFDQHRER